MLRFLFPLALLAAGISPNPSKVVIRKAVFSDRQLFWPGLEGRAEALQAARAGEPAEGRPPTISGKPVGKPHAGGKAVKGQKAGVGSGDMRPALAMLPVAIRDYRESIPCDSCHRLSANGMEFFLENYFKDRMHDRFPGMKVELISPSQPLIGSRLHLMAYLDSLDLPWARWLSDSGEQAIYRPHDRFTGRETRGKLDRLGGMLGASYLLLPARVHVAVTPRSSNTHEGGLEWGFYLMLWNVAAGSPEWAMEYREDAGFMNLDESLEGRLDKGLGRAWDRMPSELKDLWKAEPK